MAEHPCTIVVTDHRLGSLGHATNGLEDDLTDGGNCGHGCNIQIAESRASIGLELGVAHGLYQTVGDGEGEAGETQGTDPLQDSAVQPQG